MMIGSTKEGSEYTKQTRTLNEDQHSEGILAYKAYVRESIPSEKGPFPASR